MSLRFKKSLSGEHHGLEVKIEDSQSRDHRFEFRDGTGLEEYHDFASNMTLLRHVI